MPTSLIRGGAWAAVIGLVVSSGCDPVISVEPTAGTGAAGGGGGAGGDTTTGAGAGPSTTTTSSTGLGGAGGQGGAGAGIPGCATDADCTSDPSGPICDTTTGDCVACIPVDDPALDCGIGAWCVPAKGQCEVGCSGDEDCPAGGIPLVCDLEKHLCVGCIGNQDCQPGSICIGDSCIPGCAPDQPCQAGFTCCGQSCFDLASDEQSCGGCNDACPSLPQALNVCLNGSCVLSTCVEPFLDCDEVVSNGCEVNSLIDGYCTCVPGQTQPCYLGAPGTLGVGACKSGTQTCNEFGTSWGPCVNQVLPKLEICANGVDEDCDGVVDDNTDEDGDGWGHCEGDCHDTNSQVNPGALEIWYTLFDDDQSPWTPPLKVPGGNGLDDDCDPATPDLTEPPPCSLGEKLTGVLAADLAQALDLCQSAAANPPKAQKKWGVLSAELLRADGTAPEAAQLADMQNLQTAALSSYGVHVPKAGPTLVGLSTGVMRAPGGPGYVAPSPGTDLGWAGSPPASYLAAHNGVLQSNLGCSGDCPAGAVADADDGVLLRLKIRVPTNAKSFSYDFQFFSAEYPLNVCAAQNDFFLALFTSGTPGIPNDKNISFDSLGNPVSVNNSSFTACAPSGCFTCPQGTAGLSGTGMPASTGWLIADAPMVPGETVTLEFVLFDVSGGAGDSVVLVDNLRWNIWNSGWIEWW